MEIALNKAQDYNKWGYETPLKKILVKSWLITKEWIQIRRKVLEICFHYISPHCLGDIVIDIHINLQGYN